MELRAVMAVKVSFGEAFEKITSTLVVSREIVSSIKTSEISAVSVG